MTKATNLIIYFTLVVIILSLLLKAESFTNELTYTKSNLDGRKYLVRNLKDKRSAANLLAKIRGRCVYLCDCLARDFPNDEAVSRLIKNYNPDSIMESGRHSKHTSYSINKGEKIVFCIRSRDSNEKLVKTNILMFVALHELAHVMTKSIGHTDEFWDNFRFLLKQAIASKVYKHHDFRRKPVKYCGTEITDTPLND